MEGFYYGYTAERHTVVVNKEHYISVGLLQHCIHPAAVIQFSVVLRHWQLEMAEDALLLFRKSGVGFWPVEGMDFSVHGFWYLRLWGVLLGCENYCLVKLIALCGNRNPVTDRVSKPQRRKSSLGKGST